MKKYIDSHCHLQTAHDFQSMWSSASTFGICAAICNGTEPSDWSPVLKLCRDYTGIYGAIGLHPWYITKAPQNWKSEMQELLTTNTNIMVGEIGMDKFYPHLDDQAKVFEAQLDMAYRMSRPVFIHCVGAWNYILQILKSRHAHLPKTMVAHSFSEGPEIMRNLSEEFGFYFSLSPMIMDQRRKKLMESVREIPQHKLLVESDGNDPRIIISIVQRIAEIKSVETNVMADTIYKNTIEILK